MTALTVFIAGAMAGNIFGMFLMAMLVTAGRADKAKLWR
jgi:hypothetical protein